MPSFCMKTAVARTRVVVAAAMLLVACGVSHAQRVHVMFAGLPGTHASNFAKRYEEYVRDALKTTENVSMVDYAETQRLADKVGLRRYATVSRSLVKSLQRFAPDSTLVVWGRVEQYVVEPKRGGFLGLGARAVGSVSVILTMYSLHSDKYAFVGNANASASVRKPPAWFRRVALVTHITAQDRDQIALELSRQTARRTAAVIEALVRSILAQGEPPPTPPAGEEKTPSLYEVFEIPSVEGAPVEDEGEGSGPGAGSASEQAPGAEPSPDAAPQPESAPDSGPAPEDVPGE
ncbi:MAG: hypothetical protein GF418_01575 [Chitinivibrionales bacterium]|nr:hypothetical protein [Chitinivibrionales bacterium]MBD3394292.1 hypothetical protein [Chitinivibrionales bacterium]